MISNKILLNFKYNLLVHFFIIGVLTSCQNPKLISMQNTSNKPTIFDFKQGLPENISSKKIVLEKFLRTASGNMQATLLYENGDLYTIIYNKRTDFDAPSTKWDKRGELSPDDLDRIHKISESKVKDYINDGPHKKHNRALENCKWYFHFEENLFAETQKRQWIWWTTPSFVKKIDHIIENNAKQFFIKNNK